MLPTGPEREGENIKQRMLFGFPKLELIRAKVLSADPIRSSRENE
jgi:hypothetical protein